MTAEGRTGSICWARLPRAGLGNMLLVWARARVFADANSLPLVSTGWNTIRPGPFLRGELPRFYGRSFKPSHEISLWRYVWSRISLDQVDEPDLKRTQLRDDALYVFSQIPHWKDYFAGIREHRDHVREQLYKMLRSSSDKILHDSVAPVVSVHVRCGDFRKLQDGEDFAKVGLVQTPLKYFRYVISGLREITGGTLPITIFSDGTAENLKELLSLPNVHHHKPQEAIADMLLMSRSKVVVASAGSTFGYWAGFLSDGVVILHPDHIHAPLRPKGVNATLFEGGVTGLPNTWPKLLRENLEKL